MLKFQVFENGALAERWSLRNAHLIGADGNAMRASITFDHGVITCEKREAGSAALALQHPVGELGELTLRTCLLPEREEPYVLDVELARHRLMMLYVKEEEWSLFDLDADHPITKRAANARQSFIAALCAQGHDPAKAADYAALSLASALDASEELVLYHSELLLKRRRAGGQTLRFPIGCGVALKQSDERIRRGLYNNFDFLQLPIPWRSLAPEEGEYRWQLMDNWVEWANRNRMPILAGPIISFEPNNLPDWLFIWEHDYDTVRDLIYEHVEKVVTRYRGNVNVWKVVSGLHMNNHFSFNFEQLMDLTRMTTMRVKRLAPQTRALIEIREPFGEYYANNPRSIPPMMYIELLVQSGISFDGFAVQLLMGQAQSGQYTRDLMQISHLLDQFAGYGKPVYLTVGAPSEPVTQMMLPAASSGQPVDDNCGHWRQPWSRLVQAHWLEAVMQIAASKPHVEAAAWPEMMDHPQIELPLSGLVSEGFELKSAFRRLATFRRTLATGGTGQGEEAHAATVPESSSSANAANAPEQDAAQ